MELIETQPSEAIETVYSDAAKDRDIVFSHLQTVDIENVTRAEVMQHLQSLHGREFDKTLVKNVIGDFIQSHVAALAAATEQEIEEEEDEEALPEFDDDWKEQFNDVVWVKTSPQWPWYAAIIVNPFQVSNKKAREGGINFIGKRHTIYYYKTGQFDYCTRSQMRSFLEFKEDSLSVLSEKRFAKYAMEVNAGVTLAEEEIKLPKEERITASFPMFLPWSKKRKRATKPAARTAVAAPLTKKVKTALSSGNATLTIPRPAAPTVLSNNAEGSAQLKVFAPKMAPSAVSSVSKSSDRVKKANSVPAGPVEHIESEAEAEFDDNTIENNDDDYVEEKKAKKSSSTSERKKERKQEKKKSGSSEEKRSKKETSGKSSSSYDKHHSVTNDKTKNKMPSSSKSAVCKPLQSDKSPALQPKKVTVETVIETTEMRAKRLIGLLSKCGNDENQSGSTPALKEKILKYMEKLQQMKLTMDEIRSTGAVLIITQWRKHSDTDISNKAKAIRSSWKEHVQQSVGAGALPVSSATDTALELTVDAEASVVTELAAPALSVEQD